MEDNPFGAFTTSTETPSDSGFNPHIDPSLQAAIPNQYSPGAHLDQNAQHTIPFYPPVAQGANTPYQSLRGPLSTQRHEVQQIPTPTPSRSKTRTAPQTPHNTAGGQFGVLRLSYPETPLQRLQHDGGGQTPDSIGGKKEPAHFQGMKRVLDPPDLAAWRDKLFNVNEIIYLTEDEFQTYFPHVDNVYSHRSTQQYKRKPFVTSYWDCRLKGRPPGTPKSTDPNKKKRKRVARERDLCDVKIKITEYFPGARQLMNQTQPTSVPEPTHNDSFFNPDGTFESPSQAQSFAEMMSGVGVAAGEASVPGADGKRFYSIQRVNGTGANAEDDAGGGHKHDLAESDRIKKNSIIREMAKEEKEKKKVKKTYSKKATGAALATVKRHSKEHELKFYAACFCPFVQRVWIALEAKGMDYQYIEIDPYAKPKVLTDINPQGLVPAIRHGDSFSCYDSSVILQYLEDVQPNPSLNPPAPTQKAYGNLWVDHVNKSLVPGFYALLQAQETSTQLAKASELHASVDKLVAAADPGGPFFFGTELSMVDVHAAPHLLRFNRVLVPYRGWPEAEPGSRLRAWLDALEAHPAVQATISGDEVYTDSYERYAENRPGTSQVADAINEGRGLP